MSLNTPAAAHTPFPVRHLALALAVVAIWGTNFVVIHTALETLPPLLFGALRFALALVPALVIRRPDVRWAVLARYGMAIGACQFGLLMFAMNGYISPGLASLVVQSQVFFTIAFAMAKGGERIRGFQIVALLLATSGIALILAHADRTSTPLGLVLVLAAAFSWACGNHIARTSGVNDMLGFVVWSSLFSAPALFAASFVFEGPAAIASALQHATLGTWMAVLWQTTGNTLFGYAVWGWLLARHPAATITPMAMLVPVFGMGSSALLLGESLPLWKIGAGALVLSALAVNILWPRFGRFALRRALPA